MMERDDLLPLERRAHLLTQFLAGLETGLSKKQAFHAGQARLAAAQLASDLTKLRVTLKEPAE